MSVIHFYSTRDEWGEFSNFAAYRILLKKKFWPTSGTLLSGDEVQRDGDSGTYSKGQVSDDRCADWAEPKAQAAS